MEGLGLKEGHVVRMNQNHAALNRAAILVVALGLLLSVFLAGCDDFILYDQFPSQGQTDSNQLTITPAVAMLSVGETRTFEATGGAGGYSFALTEGSVGQINERSGLYDAGAVPGEATIVVTDAADDSAEAYVLVTESQDLRIVPDSVTIGVGNSYQFGSTGGVGERAFRITAGGGSITVDGLYTAPASATSAQVEVTDEAGNHAFGTANVVEGGELGITPLDPEIEEGDVVYFSGYGGLPPYDLAKAGTGVFDSVTGKYEALVDEVGEDIVTISLTDDLATTVQSLVTIRPARPGDFNVVQPDDSVLELRLTWTDNSSLETAFLIERREQQGGEFAVLDAVDANTESYVDSSGLQADTNYVYRMKTVADPLDSIAVEFTIRVKYKP